ncbi:hypothetical protein E2C01_025863 [Portunus trituberculatus]|uniref:Uncharacterized protein n=1 Tax=Portunus trituberculatus TaxID=210409 RepID=A0A5B7EE23_PORTR|nr:hypothetical protein [Portunus trituberculatus]
MEDNDDFFQKGGLQRLKISKEIGNDNSSPEQLYESLLSTISIGDDVQLVSRLICKGTPTEPLGSQSLSALQLAVTTNRVRIVNLLLAKGAMLSAGLLQVAWQNPDTSTRILAALINDNSMPPTEHRRLNAADSTPRQLNSTPGQLIAETTQRQCNQIL